MTDATTMTQRERDKLMREIEQLGECVTQPRGLVSEIAEINAMAAERGISYGQMVLELERVRRHEKAFEGCAALTSFNFPAGVVIGANAFAKTGFTSVDALGFMPQLSEGTTAHGGRYNIGQGAFANCSALAKVSGYEYRWSVGLKMTEARRDESGVWTTEVTDLGEMVEGICSFMGATLDSVFAGTALKTERDFLADHPEYTDVSTADYTCTYTAYRIV